MRVIAATVVLVCSASVQAMALTTPAAGKLDARMTTAAYNPAEVYAVHVGQGQGLAVKLCSGDTAIEVYGVPKNIMLAYLSVDTVIFRAGAEQLAGAPIFVRARAADGTTARTYALMADTKPPEDAPLSVAFVCQQEDAAKRNAAWAAGKAARDQKAAEAALKLAAQTRCDGDDKLNYAYTLQGKRTEDWELLPSRQVVDDGEQTRFCVGGLQRVPVIYIINPDGKEAVVKNTFDPSTGVITVYQTARDWRMRDGENAVLCVHNLKFSATSPLRSETHTISPNVERIVK